MGEKARSQGHVPPGACTLSDLSLLICSQASEKENPTALAPLCGLSERMPIKLLSAQFRIWHINIISITIIIITSAYYNLVATHPVVRFRLLGRPWGSRAGCIQQQYILGRVFISGVPAFKLNLILFWVPSSGDHGALTPLAVVSTFGDKVDLPPTEPSHGGICGLLCRTRHEGGGWTKSEQAGTLESCMVRIRGTLRSRGPAPCSNGETEAQGDRRSPSLGMAARWWQGRLNPAAQSPQHPRSRCKAPLTKLLCIHSLYC